MVKFIKNLGFDKVNWTILLLNVIVSFGFFFMEIGDVLKAAPGKVDSITSVFLWSSISLIAGITNVICVIFVANKDIRNYAFGIITVVYYAFVSYYYGNTGEWMLSLFVYVPMNVVGWSLWIKAQKKSTENAVHTNEEDENIVESRTLSLKEMIPCVGILVMGVFIYAQVLSADVVQMMLYGELTNHPVSKYYIDSFTTMASVLAMFLCMHRYMEQWYLWVIVNIMSIVLWCVTPGKNYLMIIMWTSLLANSIYGVVRWRKGHY